MRVIMSLCIAVLPILPLGAQDPAPGAVDSTTSSKESPYRNPHRALVLGSLIPGAGHIYAGEYLHGFLTYEGTVGAIGMGTLVFIMDRCTFTFLNAEPCKSGPAWPHRVAGATIVAWASGIGFPAHETPHEPPNVRTSGTVGGRGPVVQSSIRFPDRRMRPRLECPFIGSVPSLHRN